MGIPEGLLGKWKETLEQQPKKGKAFPGNAKLTENERNMTIIQEFRANGRKVGGRFAGKSLLLLHILGAKSGQPRINPVACIRDADRLVIIASKGGALTNPDWCYNILANPLVSVETGAEEIQARASIAEEPERTRLYDQMVEIMPGFAEYQRRTTRVIPVIILTPVK